MIPGEIVPRAYLVLAPAYLACLLLLKAMKTILNLIAPVGKVLPQSVLAENLIAIILVLVAFLLGLRFAHEWDGRSKSPGQGTDSLLISICSAMNAAYAE